LGDFGDFGGRGERRGDKYGAIVVASGDVVAEIGEAVSAADDNGGADSRLLAALLVAVRL